MRANNIVYTIQSKDTGIYHLVREHAGALGLRWTYCGNVVSKEVLSGGPPSGYRLCHNCNVVQQRETARVAAEES